MGKPCYLGEVIVAFVMVVFVAGVGSILGLALYATQLHALLPVFAGPTYLFFILAGSSLGHIVNGRQRSRAAPWAWILPTIWSVSAAAGDLSSGIHNGENVLGYVWNTLILGNHELALTSQWIIGAPFLTSVSYSFGAWLALRRAPQT